MASRIRIMAQVGLVAGCLAGGLAAQTRYVPDKVGKWMLRSPDYSAGKDQYRLSPVEKSSFETKIGALIATIQQCKVFSPPMGIEPQVITRYYAGPSPADEADLCENQPCASHPPGFYFFILPWYHVLTEPKDGFGHIDYQAPLVVGLVNETAQEVWVAVNNLTRTPGDLPWAAPRRLPDGCQIHYMPRETATRVGGFPVYENHLGDHLILAKRDRAPCGRRSLRPVAAVTCSLSHGQRLHPELCQTSMERQDGRGDQDDCTEYQAGVNREIHLVNLIVFRLLLKSSCLVLPLRSRIPACRRAGG